MSREKKPQGDLYSGDGEVIIPYGQKRSAYGSRPGTDSGTAVSHTSPTASRDNSAYMRPAADSRLPYGAAPASDSRPVYGQPPVYGADVPPERKYPSASDNLYGRYRPNTPRELPVSDPRDNDWEEPTYYVDDGLGQRKRRKKRKPFFALWLFLFLFSIAGLIGLAVLVVPQLFGVQYRFLPNIAFVNQHFVSMDAGTYSTYKSNRQYIDTDAIYPGVYIDGIHVGGMTRAEAIAAVSQVSPVRQVDFNITINIGNASWHVTQDDVAVSRSIPEMVEKAWWYGRGSTVAERGMRSTPFRQRIDVLTQLQQQPVYLTTEETFDATALKDITLQIAEYINRDPVNASVASFNFDDHTFTFNADVSGVHIEADAVYDRILTALNNEMFYAVITMEPQIILARVTKAELINSFTRISSYTTKTTDNKNRNTNIQLSAKAINGVTVLPGQMFSFNDTTGERTAEKGYKPAAAISGGQTNDEIGGGVCQTSSTLFNAVARANLQILQRSPHAWPSNYVEKGMDATVNWPGLDFKFRNNTDWPIFIVAEYSNRKVTVDIYGMQLGDGISIDLESTVTRTIEPPSDVKYVQNPDLPRNTNKTTVKKRTGYVVQTWQIWYQNGVELKREKLCNSTYKAYQQTVEYN